MKKLLLFIVFTSILLIGCKKDTIYQIYNNCSVYHSDVDPLLNGTFYEVVVLEYLGEDIVMQKNIKKIEVGKKSEEFTMHGKAEKIKISFELLPKESAFYGVTSRLYTAQYFYLEPGKLTLAEINDKTMLSEDPKSPKQTTTDEVTIENIRKSILK
jgi:hypothetical protein